MVTEGHGEGCFDVRGKGKTSIVARSERFQVQLGGSNILHETRRNVKSQSVEGMGGGFLLGYSRSLLAAWDWR